MRVTSDPSLDHTLPNSNPIIPAPTIPTVFGNFLNDSAPVLATMCSLKLAEGISIGLEPVARIIFFVSFLEKFRVCEVLIDRKSVSPAYNAEPFISDFNFEILSSVNDDSLTV